MLTFPEHSLPGTVPNTHGILSHGHNTARSRCGHHCGVQRGTEAQDVREPTAATRLVKAEPRFKPTQFDSGATCHKPAPTHTPHLVGSVSKYTPSETVSLMVVCLAVPLVWDSTSGQSVRLRAPLLGTWDVFISDRFY